MLVFLCLKSSLTLSASAPLQRHRVFSNETLFYHLDDVECSGNENTLSQCGHSGVGFHSCLVRQHEAGVTCESRFYL